MSKDSITKDVYKIKKCYIKQKYMEYATYEGLKKELDKLYKEYEEKNTKTNRDYIIRQNRLSRDYFNGIKNIVTAFVIGIASSAYLDILGIINESKVEGDSVSINLVGIIGYGILLFMLWHLALFFNKEGINRYANDIEQYEIDLIDKILKERYNKLKGIRKSKRIRKIKNR